jgi:tight adherence protein B
VSVVAALAIGWCCASLAALVAGLRLPVPTRSNGTPGRLAARARARRVWLQQAGLSVSPLQFASASAAAGLAALLLLAAVVGPFVALVPALGLCAAPRAFYARRRDRRLSEVQRAWPDGLRDMLAAIASGQSIGAAVEELAARGPEPLQVAFARFPGLRRSLGTAPALEAVREDLADPVSDRVIEVLILASERGGSIVRTVLEDLTEAITADLKMSDEIQTAMLESRINARAVVAMPWFVLVMLNVGNGPFREFYRSTGGLVTIMVGAVLSAVGSALIARLSRMPVEERVLGSAA